MTSKKIGLPSVGMVFLLPVLVMAGAVPALAAGKMPGLGDDKLRVPCENPVPGRYIVVLNKGTFRDKASPATVLAPAIGDVADEMSRVYSGRLSAALEHVLKGFTVNIDAHAARRLAYDARVAYVEQGCPVYLAAEQGSPPWNLDRVDQAEQPLNQIYSYNETGAGVNVYVIDTGITPHSEFLTDLGVNRLRAGRNFFRDNGVDPVPTRTDDCWAANGFNGHGTAVAGIAGGTVTGVAKKVDLYPIRVYGCSGTSDTTQIVEGLNWVAGNHVKPAVANLSLGDYNPLPSLDNAVRDLINAGVVVVMAAGNLGQPACNYSPARVTEGLTVGGSTQADQRRTSSNHGGCVDLFAPGEQIWAPGKNGSYSFFTGTSFAAPHVTGAAALFLAGNGGASVATVNAAIEGHATVGQLSLNVGDSSPNRLLFAKPTDACFDWSCDPATRTCSFSPGCSKYIHGLAYYQWDFGDGQQVLTTNNYVNHTYATQDIYAVALWVVPAAGDWEGAGACVNVTHLGTTCEASGHAP